jgi:hypothetical protein
LVLQNGWELGVGLTTPPCKTIIVTKRSKKERRPKPTPGCSAEKEEEELSCAPKLKMFTTNVFLSVFIAHIITINMQKRKTEHKIIL